MAQLHDTSFGGHGSETVAWVRFLEQRTGLSGLDEMTVGRWGHTLTRRGSGRSHQKWCPHCLDDSLGSGQPYLPLLWSIGIVDACPIHGCGLESVCPHCGQGQTGTGRRTKRFAMSFPGVCAGCGGWLGAHDGARPDAPPRQVATASGYDVCVAAQVGGLLAEPLREGEFIDVSAVLRAAAKRYFAGSMVKLSDWIGLNKSTVHGWLEGCVVPELGRLAALAIKLRIGLRDLMVGKAEALPSSLSEPSAGLEGYDRSKPNPHLKRAAIAALLEDDPGISVRQVARQIGMNHRDVYYYHANAVRDHSRLGREVALDIRAIESADAVSAVQRKCAEENASGMSVSIRELREVVRDIDPTLTYVEQQALVNRALGELEVTPVAPDA